MSSRKHAADRPAFSRPGSAGPEGFERAQKGLTVREFAAIQVLASLLTGEGSTDVLDPRTAAAIAVEYANALAEALQPEERH